MLIKTRDLHLSRLIIDPTISLAVMTPVSSSCFLRLTNHQSTAKIPNASILIPAHSPTYLYRNCSMSYSKQRPPFSPQALFHNKQVESIKLPKRIGAGMYPNKRNITNCMPKAKDRSSSLTDLESRFCYFHLKKLI